VPGGCVRDGGLRKLEPKDLEQVNEDTLAARMALARKQLTTCTLSITWTKSGTYPGESTSAR
jgi:hypothetical protein